MTNNKNFHELAQELSIKFENKIGGIFKKYNLLCDKLDKDKKGRRPDYFVTKNKEGFICECKFIASAGITSDRKYHISTLDSNLYQSGTFQPDISIKLVDVLRGAKNQFKQLVAVLPEYGIYPFVVAVGSDFFADNFDLFIPSNIYGLEEISAIIKLEKNVELETELKKYNLEELIRIIDKKMNPRLPQESVRFKVILNANAKVKFRPNYFLKNPIIK